MFGKNFRKLPRLFFVLIAVLTLGLQFPAEGIAGGGKKHFLWKVSSDTNTVYIMGSLHLLRKEDYPLPKAFEDAYQDSEVLVFEVDPGTLNTPETVRMMLSKATLGKDVTLDQVISEDTYGKTKRKLNLLGADILMYQKSKPWFVAVTLGFLKLKSIGLDPSDGVDMYYYDKAVEDGKEIEGLETAEFQVDMLARAGEENEDAYLLQTLEDLDLMDDELHEMLDSWSKGNAARFQKAMFKSYKDYPEVFDSLLVERNKNWLPQVEKLIGQDEDYLVIVGSGHLVGKDGLINLLSEKGYEIEQL
jgi:uncharacterized protein YbaP (TraB family)